MGWFTTLCGKLLGGAPSGVRIDYNKPHWLIQGKTDFPSFLRTLKRIVPPDCVLYLEGGFYRGELKEFLVRESVPNPINIAPGTFMPKCECFHIAATQENFSRLIEFAEKLVYPEIAIHFHVYRCDQVILEWHDILDDKQPMVISPDLGEANTRELAETLKMNLSVCDAIHTNPAEDKEKPQTDPFR